MGGLHKQNHICAAIVGPHLQSAIRCHDEFFVPDVSGIHVTGARTAVRYATFYYVNYKETNIFSTYIVNGV